MEEMIFAMGILGLGRDGNLARGILRAGIGRDG